MARRPGEGSPYRVALLEWEPRDGITDMIRHELACLGHDPVCFTYGESVPEGVEVVLSYGPYAKLLPMLQEVAGTPAEVRPTVFHWNTEGFPDLRIPLWVMGLLGDLRSWLGRFTHSDRPWVRDLGSRRLISMLDARATRFRYVGDYRFAFRRGLIDVLADCSQIYVGLHRRQGIRALYLPWGCSSVWYADLGLERDIDVLWMGKRGSARRSRLLDRVREELRRRGVEMYVADNEERPFVFRAERTELLNRAKITLNITRTWYDDNYLRFALAAPNRSLIVSEPMLPHCPAYRPGVHYVSAPVERLAETIVYYLKHEDERRSIVENAHRLLTTELAFRDGAKRVMEVVAEVRGRSLGSGPEHASA